MLDELVPQLVARFRKAEARIQPEEILRIL
jgi:hypothetical protein